MLLRYIGAREKEKGEIRTKKTPFCKGVQGEVQLL